MMNAQASSPPAARDDNRPRGLLVVSNRLPVTVRRLQDGVEITRSAGGLVTALDPALRASGGVWIGWPGSRVDDDVRLVEDDHPYWIEPVQLSDSEVRHFYHGFANRTLWPLFHCLPERTRFDRQAWRTYETVNRRFATVTERFARENPGGLIWVHDYQLMRTPRHLRNEIADARLAFFLHIPFPPFDLFRILPWSRELLRGMLACDLIGFHVENYAGNFLDCVERLLGAEVDRKSGLVHHDHRTTRVGAFPLGIDFDTFERNACNAGEVVERPPQHLILGVDRLDYTKGIPERIQAFERLLELHKEHRGRACLFQLAVPSRAQVTEYRELKREIDELVGRINGRFATSSWTPIHYFYRTLTPESLAGLYRIADVALVTPLRDGMNLVAKEYVACQTDNPGVLVLSRMAGAAETMPEALRVNPYDIDNVAYALHRALTMPERERAERMNALRQRERDNDVHAWTRRFLDTAAHDISGPGRPNRRRKA